MANPLASTVFVTGAKDKLATLDVYKASNKGNAAQVITAVQSIIKKSNLDLGSILGKVPGKTDLFSSALGKLAPDADAIKSRLLGEAHAVKGSFNALSSDLQAKFTGALSGVAGKASDKLSIDLGGKKLDLGGGAFADVSKYGKLVNDFTGKSAMSLVDKTAIGSFTASLVAQGSSLGIPNSFSALTEGIADVTILNQVVKDAVPKLSALGDIGGLKDMSLNPMVKSTLSILFPDFGNKIAQSYTALTSENPAMRKQSWNNLLTMMNNVDSTWDQYTRLKSSEKCVNLLSFLGASEDFKTLIRAGVALKEENEEKRRWKDCYALSTVYRQTTVEDELRRAFPNLILEATMMQYGSSGGSDTRKTNAGLLDPRALSTARKLVNSLAG